MVTLYHYIHCPFCVRVRLALGFLKINYQSKVLPYHDEKTPLALTNIKMLPIITKADGTHMNESLDIIQNLDANDILSFKHLNAQTIESLGKMLNSLGSPIHSLCMPYWVYTKEFDEKSRHYFQSKKEKKRGLFRNLILNKDKYLNQLIPLLEEVENKLIPYYESERLSIKDIMLASHLWGLYIFPEFQFSIKINTYLQEIKKQCQFEYHEDFWSEN
ncbi:MAG: glutaredoxin 2 [Bacteriovoracaceae bacterium]|jgi:glutaredoxin 2|nr:glutaredoxin 2 [Bacteriovoracaceae bacterium]